MRRAERDGIESNTVLRNQSLAAWRTSGDTERVEAEFGRMVRSYERGDDGAARPDVVSLNTVLGALADRGEGERAERILNRLLETKEKASDDDDVRLITLDVVTYNTVLKAHAESSTTDPR